jgi:hypothetical protein
VIDVDPAANGEINVITEHDVSDKRGHPTGQRM